MRFRERLVFFVFGCVFVIAGQVVTGLVVPPAEAQSAIQDAVEAGRYQLAGATYEYRGHRKDGGYAVVEQPGVFKIDTSTGEVWRYRFNFDDRPKQDWSREMWFPITGEKY